MYQLKTSPNWEEPTLIRKSMKITMRWKNNKNKIWLFKISRRVIPNKNKSQNKNESLNTLYSYVSQIFIELTYFYYKISNFSM